MLKSKSNNGDGLNDTKFNNLITAKQFNIIQMFTIQNSLSFATNLKDKYLVLDMLDKEKVIGVYTDLDSLKKDIGSDIKKFTIVTPIQRYKED